MILHGGLITSVNCPICKDSISGDGPEKLSMKLEAHFVKSHQLTKTAKPKGQGTCAPECAPGPVGPSAKEYKAVETFGPSNKAGSSYVGSEKEINDVTRFKGETSGGEKEIDEVTRFTDEPKGGEKEIDEVTRFKGETTGGQKEIDAVTSFKGETMGGKKEIDAVTSFRTQNCMCGTGSEFVTCPMCMSEIHGEDDMDLSNNLGRHLKEAHQV